MTGFTKAEHSASGILIEAEDFDDYGGWMLDSQFEAQMGSPYLLAHGLGRPVADATTSIEVSIGAEYEVWVRAKDWVPGYHPGRFKLLINGQVLETEFGANDQDWSWQSAGKITLPQGPVRLALHDQTGFDGRCDAIFFSADGTVPPNTVDAGSRAWRKAFEIPDRRPEAPEPTKPADLAAVLLLADHVDGREDAHGAVQLDPFGQRARRRARPRRRSGSRASESCRAADSARAAPRR